jgi:cysteine desulfuration protein SufE
MNSEILELMTLNDIRSNFALLDDWEDRYRYLIEIGRELPPLESRAKVEANKVRGCASQVWLLTDVGAAVNGGGPVLNFKGDSDALIVRGLIAVLFAMYDGHSAEDILRVDAAKEFASLGLKDHLTPQRSNGFASMVERIRSDARAAASATASS